MVEFIFYLVAGFACVFALLTVVSRNIFHSAIYLTLVLLSIAGIYFYLDAEFLGIIQVLIYVGAIITLFVFAIMLTAKMDDVSIKQVNDQVAVSAAVSLGLFFALVTIININPWFKGIVNSPSVSLKQLGESLLTVYVLPFEFISLILLATLVGAIVIGKAKK